MSEIELEANLFACHTIQLQIRGHLHQGRKFEDVRQYKILTV